VGEKETAPEQVIARGNTDPSGAGKGTKFEQPICAYPQAAQYKGQRRQEGCGQLRLRGEIGRNAGEHPTDVAGP